MVVPVSFIKSSFHRKLGLLRPSTILSMQCTSKLLLLRFAARPWHTAAHYHDPAATATTSQQIHRNGKSSHVENLGRQYLPSHWRTHCIMCDQLNQSLVSLWGAGCSNGGGARLEKYAELPRQTTNIHHSLEEGNCQVPLLETTVCCQQAGVLTKPSRWWD